MNAKHVFVVVTSHSELGSTGKKTGLWFEELATPYFLFRDAGFLPVLISPAGGPAPVDPGSRLPCYRGEGVERFTGDSAALAALERTIAVDDAPEDFAALFLVGGHGTMWDFPSWHGLSHLLDRACVENKPIGAVCHGVSGLLTQTTDSGLSRVRGRRLTGFSNDEEAAVALTQVVPFMLQDALISAGATYIAGTPFEEHVVIDGNLVTGQNPNSSLRAGEALLSLMVG